jgi:hypothetical protein
MTARSLSLVTAFCLALSGCDELTKMISPPSKPEAAQPQRTAAEHEAQAEAEILIGRIEVMQEQTINGLEILASGAHSDASLETPTDRDTYRRLYEAVGRYNALRKTACTRRVARGELCGPEPFLPLWYAGRARPDTSPEGLKKAAEEMQERMMPLWDAVCAKAKAKSGDEHLCAIE